MSKQPRPPQKSGPSYAEIKAQNETLQQALASACEQLQQYQVVAQHFQASLNAVGVLSTRLAYIVTETLASAVPDAIVNNLVQQAAQREAAAQGPKVSGDNHRPRGRAAVGEPGLAKAPVFSGVPKESGSSVSLTGEAADDDFDPDDDDKI